MLEPSCPHCGNSIKVSISFHPVNLILVPLATIVGFAIADLIPICWRCSRDNIRFFATSDAT